MSATTTVGLVESIMRWTDSRTPRVAIGVNAHVSNLVAASSTFREKVASADIRYADGQSIVIASRMLRHPLPERVATTDLVYPLARSSALEGKRIFLFGGAPGVAADAARILREFAPGLAVESRDGYADAQRVEELLSSITTFRTDVLFVGLGDPRQQDWIDAYRDRLECGAILSCGGLFDWTSGRNRRAPKWMISGGMEWLWRFAIEPRRLGRRYLLGNPLFVLRLARQIVVERLRPSSFGSPNST